MSDLMKDERHFFIADTHFGHNGIHERFRTEFSSQQEHDDTIHNNILVIGDTNKTLWILGDSFFKTREFWRLKEYASKFQQVNVVLGNHCHVSLPRYAVQFKNVNVFGVVQRFGLWLTHVPVPDYELYRGKCIHGHLHNKKVTLPDSPEEDMQYFCVSCERVGYKPISLNRIKQMRGWEDV